MPTPLDLTDMQLMAHLPKSIKSTLDVSGRNASGILYASILARALLLMDIIREEVLEISLRRWNDCSELLPEHHYPEHKLSEARNGCSRIMRRCKEICARMPESIRYKGGDIRTAAQILPPRIGLQLVYLHSL